MTRLHSLCRYSTHHLIELRSLPSSSDEHPRSITSNASAGPWAVTQIPWATSFAS